LLSKIVDLLNGKMGEMGEMGEMREMGEKKLLHLL
jgi:hypothetical protein